MRNDLYERIGQKTERWKIASECFKLALCAGLAEDEEERNRYETERREWLFKLESIPLVYLPLEQECIRQSWEQVTQFVGAEYQDKIVENSRHVIGKTVSQIVKMELGNYQINQHPALRN